MVLQLLEDRCRTPYGKTSARTLVPSPSREVAQRLQSASREMLQFRKEQGSLPLSLSTDVRPFLDRLGVEGSALTGMEIHLLVEQVRCGLEVRATLLRCPQKDLRERGRSLPDLGNLARYLDGKTTPSGLLEDRCSTDLLQVRRQISSVSLRLESELTAISGRGEMARALQDDFIALRNGRHVLPVRIDAQGFVEGIVHALSSSGATVYMEPLSTVPLNNELVRLREQEEVEVQRLLLEFSDLFRSRLSELLAMLDDLAELDLLQARAILAEEMQGIDPDFSEEPSEASPLLHLSAARHPLLERALQASGRPLIPLDMTLDKDQRVLIVSGPNTGGKTVALKTVGLLALMAQSGLKLPATQARLPVFRRILIDIGDHQSIPDSLSTFSARMANISEMSREVADPALVLLDEVGSGTDPEEGACLGVAIIDYFRRRGAVVVATTHQQGIKAYAAVTSCVANACMEFDEGSLRPLYRLRVGAPGRSGGLDMAESLGLPREIVRHARSLVPRQREILDSYLHALQALQEDLRRETASAEQAAGEARRREAVREETEARLSRERESRFSRFLEETSSALRVERETFLSSLADRESERRFRRELEKRDREMMGTIRASLDPDLAPTSKREPRRPVELLPGARVRVSSLGLSGIVDHVAGGSVLIRSGAKLLKASREDLEFEEESAPQDRGLPPGVRLTRAEAPQVGPELNLIGKTVEEALPMLDKYLDDASLSRLSPVRIIHGMGTGRLRAAVRSFLEAHPHVESFSQAEERQGGRGVTVVRLHL
ncbi:MAG TPA: Smr/MutS family protein [Candidatus Polarisedimenticolia bacterium]|nr:Smr/MutS family protein [Candidatus Polarisedimenticolia bacterium]